MEEEKILNHEPESKGAKPISARKATLQKVATKGDSIHSPSYKLPKQHDLGNFSADRLVNRQDLLPINEPLSVCLVLLGRECSFSPSLLDLSVEIPALREVERGKDIVISLPKPSASYQIFPYVKSVMTQHMKCKLTTLYVAYKYEYYIEMKEHIEKILNILDDIDTLVIVININEKLLVFVYDVTKWEATFLHAGYLATFYMKLIQNATRVLTMTNLTKILCYMITQDDGRLIDQFFWADDGPRFLEEHNYCSGTKSGFFPPVYLPHYLEPRRTSKFIEEDTRAYVYFDRFDLHMQFFVFMRVKVMFLTDEIALKYPFPEDCQLRVIVINGESWRGLLPRAEKMPGAGPIPIELKKEESKEMSNVYLEANPKATFEALRFLQYKNISLTNTSIVLQLNRFPNLYKLSFSDIGYGTGIVFDDDIMGVPIVSFRRTSAEIHFPAHVTGHQRLLLDESCNNEGMYSVLRAYRRIFIRTAFIRISYLLPLLQKVQYLTLDGFLRFDVQMHLYFENVAFLEFCNSNIYLKANNFPKLKYLKTVNCRVHLEGEFKVLRTLDMNGGLFMAHPKPDLKEIVENEGVISPLVHKYFWCPKLRYLIIVDLARLDRIVMDEHFAPELWRLTLISEQRVITLPTIPQKLGPCILFRQLKYLALKCFPGNFDEYEHLAVNLNIKWTAELEIDGIVHIPKIIECPMFGCDRARINSEFKINSMPNAKGKGEKWEYRRNQMPHVEFLVIDDVFIDLSSAGLPVTNALQIRNPNAAPHREIATFVSEFEEEKEKFVENGTTVFLSQPHLEPKNIHHYVDHISKMQN